MTFAVARNRNKALLCACHACRHDFLCMQALPTEPILRLREYRAPVFTTEVVRAFHVRIATSVHIDDEYDHTQVTKVACVVHSSHSMQRVDRLLMADESLCGGPIRVRSFVFNRSSVQARANRNGNRQRLR